MVQPGKDKDDKDGADVEEGDLGDIVGVPFRRPNDQGSSIDVRTKSEGGYADGAEEGAEEVDPPDGAGEPVGELEEEDAVKGCCYDR